MTLPKHFLRAGLLLLLIFCFPTALVSKDSEGQRATNSAQTEPSLATRKGLYGLALALANCSDGSKTCKKTFGARELALSLKYEHWRATGRYGFDKLNFDDFTALHRVYGNALAKLAPIKALGEILKVWVLNTPDEEQGILMDHIPIDMTSTTPDTTSYGPNAPRTEIPVLTYATMLAQVMDRNTDGRVDVDEFTDWMVSKQ
jgi:hypothetical protein